MITILLIIGFLGMMFGLVVALFAGIASAIGTVVTVLFSALVRSIEKSK